MTAAVVDMKGQPVSPPPAGKTTRRTPWDKAVRAALADGATMGVLVYVTKGDPDEVSMIPVGCGRIVSRGLLEEAREWASVSERAVARAECAEDEAGR